VYHFDLRQNFGAQGERFAEIISAKYGAGLTAQRIYQDLVEERAFTGSYQSVKRYIPKLKEEQPERGWRMECQPGEEMQVDFGLGAPIETENGKTRRSWVFRLVLSHSRKGYSEAVFRQDTETFLRCIENAIRHFGGAPLLINLDNLKAAVLKADCFDPEINPKLAEFCRHYGRSVMPCRPRTPKHKFLSDGLGGLNPQLASHILRSHGP
jgi:transposase